MELIANIKKDTVNFSINVKLTVTQGTTGILGMSGSGKSMFFKCLAGIETPDYGEIMLDGEILFSSEKKINLPIRKRKIAYLFQNCGLFPNMTVEENIKICSKGESVDEIVEICRVQPLLKSYPNKLSGGEKQRVAIARILVSKPKVILLDEPFSAMDEPLKEDIQADMLKVLSNFEGIVFIVSHSVKELYRFSKDIAVIHKGEIIQHEEKQRLYSEPKTPMAAKLLGFDNIIKLDEDIKSLLDLNTDKEYLCFKSNQVDLKSNDLSSIKVIEIIKEMDYYIIHLRLTKDVTIKVISKTSLALEEKMDIRFTKEPLQM